jgi:hypothetical protein
MSWYYVGPDASPVGPISLDDLQARRASGAVGLDTYVIEAPAGSAPKEWRRYRDIFAPAPPAAILPPLPGTVPPPAPTMGIPHPLFPSALPPSPSPGGPVFTGIHPSSYHLPPSRTNAWCSWGFGLGLASLPFLLCAGVGVLLALGGLVASIVGIVQTGHHREERGRVLGFTGLGLSILALLLSVVLIGAVMASSSLRGALSMTTEQTANDSDTR